MRPAGDRALLERLGRHPALGPHHQLAVQDQAVRQVPGRSHEIREAAPQEAARGGTAPAAGREPATA
ncbi:hypothetical protein AB0H29_16630 [Streptomyces thermolilacinus]